MKRRRQSRCATVLAAALFFANAAAAWHTHALLPGFDGESLLHVAGAAPSAYPCPACTLSHQVGSAAMLAGADAFLAPVLGGTVSPPVTTPGQRVPVRGGPRAPPA